MAYTWNQLRFEVPAGLVDQTVVSFVDDVEQPTFTITIAPDAKSGSLSAWVDAQLEDLARSLPGYAQTSRKAAKAGKAEAVVVEHKARSPQGQPMRQRQAYVDAGATFAVITMTCADKPHSAADAAFDGILQELLMGIDDVTKKARYAKKPPMPREIAHPSKVVPGSGGTAGGTASTTGAVATTTASTTAPSVIATAFVAGEVNAAAKAALGFADAGVSAPKTVAAKTAVHQLGFFERTGRSMKKGLLVALMGLQLGGNMAASTAPMKGLDGPRQQITQVLDQRQAESTGRGQRALPDAQIVLDKWETLAAHDKHFSVGHKRAEELILKALLPAQPAAGEDVAAFAAKNLGPDTRALIQGLLSQSRIHISDDARALFTKVSAAAPVVVTPAPTTTTGSVVSSDGKVTVVGDQGGGPAGQGRISVKAPAGAQVEVINLSTIPTKRLHTDDTFVLGTVGASGAFAGNMEMQPGDAIRLRVKMPDGTASAWVDFKAQGMGADTRNAEVALFRVGLVDAGNGKIAVNNINEGRPVSEPGATARFVNNRTGASTDVVFDKDGTFAKDQTLPGQAGDTFSVRVTDGVNDTALTKEVGTVTVRDAGTASVNVGFHLPMPALHHDEMDNGKPKFSTERYHGPLFDQGATYTDVTQGQLGDCYFPSSISTIAFHKPGTFEKIMQEKHETDPQTGEDKVWYEVHFKDWNKQDVTVKVDGDLYVRSWGGPLYGSDDASDRSPEHMEMWFSILEKAYAQWKGGSYENIGNGGTMDQVFQDVLGVDATSTTIANNLDNVWKQIQTNVDKHRPIGAGTFGDDQEAMYANTGVYADHAYSLLGYKTEKGEKYVQMRNPWGESEPFPGDGKNDGIFWIKLADFGKLYQTLFYATTDQ